MGHFPNFMKVIFSNKKILVYHGFLGDRNFGDELVYKATKSLNNSFWIIPIQRHMPILLKLYCIIFWRRISGVIIGGGTLMRSNLHKNNFILKLVNSGRKVFFHGTGVDEIVGAKEYCIEILFKEFYGGVRGPLSINNISTNLNLSIDAIGDAAFGLYTGNLQVRKIENKSILINFGTHVEISELIKCRNEVELFANYCLKKGYDVLFLPMHEIDIKCGHTLKKSIPQLVILEIPNEYDEAISHFKNCSFAVGERLHFNILSLMGGCPFLSINYDKKHIDFLESCDISFAGSSIEDISKLQLVDFFENKTKLFNWKMINDKLLLYNSKQKEEFNKFINSNVFN